MFISRKLHVPTYGKGPDYNITFPGKWFSIGLGTQKVPSLIQVVDQCLV